MCLNLLKLRTKILQPLVFLDAVYLRLTTCLWAKAEGRESGIWPYFVNTWVEGTAVQTVVTVLLVQLHFTMLEVAADSH